ncbi:MAG: hypothetical protein ACOZNI_28095 [Myxococcota bacterium]
MQLAAYGDAPRAIRLFPSHALQRLLARHARDCAALGLRLDRVADEDDGVVHAWLRARASLLPLGLADDLERIEDLASDRGAATLIEAARRAGADFRSLGLDSLEVAARAFLDHREIFDAAHGRHVIDTLRGTTEFAGRRAGPGARFGDARLRALEADLGRQFDARARSAHCRITVGSDEDRLVFTVAHGALVRADEALDERPSLVSEGDGPVYFADRAVRYRPQRRDVVVYEAGAGRLRIRASDAPTVRAYRRAFGELLMGDEEWFGNEEVVSLAPLSRLGRDVEIPTPGLREVRVVGLVLRHSEPAGKMALEADEIWPYLDGHLVHGLAGAAIHSVTFRMFVEGSSAVGNVTLREPSRYDSSRLPDELVRSFLEARGLLARAEGDAR